MALPRDDQWFCTECGWLGTLTCVDCHNALCASCVFPGRDDQQLRCYECDYSHEGAIQCVTTPSALSAWQRFRQRVKRVFGALVIAAVCAMLLYVAYLAMAGLGG